jgi:putative transposase
MRNESFRIILPLTTEAFMRKRYSEEQIIRILHEASAGVPVKDLMRRYGISENTFFRWRSKYGGMDVSEVRRLRDLEGENGRLKRLLATRDLEIDALKEVMQKNF